MGKWTDVDLDVTRIVPGYLLAIQSIRDEMHLLGAICPRDRGKTFLIPSIHEKNIKYSECETLHL